MTDIGFKEALTFTRSSEGTFIGADGSIQTASVDEPRFTHHAETGEALGLMIEESRTRLNTIAAEPADPEDVVVDNVAYVLSFYGTGSVDLSGAATETLLGSGENERVKLTFTPNAGTLTLTPTGEVTDLQLEKGSFATSVIRGEGSSVTRAIENCWGALGEEFNINEGTMYVECITKGVASNSSAVSLLFGTTSSFNAKRYQIDQLPNGTVRLMSSDDTGTFPPVLSFSGEVGQPYKAAISFDIGSGAFSGSVNGAPTKSDTRTLSIPDAFRVGGLFGSSSQGLSGSVLRIRYIPRALTAAELEKLTAP